MAQKRGCAICAIYRIIAKFADLAGFAHIAGLNWEILSSSDKWEKQDYRTIHIPVAIPANGEKKVTYTVRYSW